MLAKDYTLKNQRWFDLFQHNDFVFIDGEISRSDKDLRLLVIRDKDQNINNALPLPIFLEKMGISYPQFFKLYSSTITKYQITRTTYNIFQQYNIDINVCLKNKPIYELNSYHFDTVQDTISIYPQMLEVIEIGNKIYPYCSGYIPSNWSVTSLEVIKRYNRPNKHIWVLTQIKTYYDENGRQAKPEVIKKWFKLIY